MSTSYRLSEAALPRLLAMVFAAALALALVPLSGVSAQVDDDENGNDREIDGEIEERGPVPGEQVASTRFAGRERFSTAGLIAVDTYVETSTAVVARHNEFADALAGGYLAGQLSAPILLVSPQNLQEPTLAAMDELGVDEVVLLGGTEAISEENESRLETEEGKTVSRIFGETRYETARDIALREGNVVGQHNEMNTAILATGIVFADALSSGPLASARDFPILLTPSQSLHPAAVEALEGLDIEQVIIMGQTDAVSAEVEAEVEAMDIETIRLGGTTRVETADEIARFAIDELGFTAEDHGWARGNEFADALAIGPRLGLMEAPVLLTVTENRWDSGEDTNAEFAAEFACDVTRIDLAGGTAAISEDVADEIRSALACPGEPAQILLESDVESTGTGEWAALTATVTDNTGAELERVEVTFEVDEATPGAMVRFREEAGAPEDLEDITVETDVDGMATVEATSDTPARVAFVSSTEVVEDDFLFSNVVTVDYLPADPGTLPGVTTFDLELSSEKEVGDGTAVDVDPAFTGEGTIFTHSDFGLVCWDVNIDVDSGDGEPGSFQAFDDASPFSASHIHEGDFETAGPIVIDLGTPDDESGEGDGCTFADVDLVTAIETGPADYYFNAHTNLYPGGLVRDQLG